jgi:hypothetical protein
VRAQGASSGLAAGVIEFEERLLGFEVGGRLTTIKVQRVSSERSAGKSRRNDGCTSW